MGTIIMAKTAPYEHKIKFKNMFSLKQIQDLVNRLLKPKKILKQSLINKHLQSELIAMQIVDYHVNRWLSISSMAR